MIRASPSLLSRALAAADSRALRRYGEAFAAEICALGYPAELAQALLAGVDEDAVGVGFEPSALFEQTPGPHAGERLEPKA